MNRRFCCLYSSQMNSKKKGRWWQRSIDRRSRRIHWRQHKVLMKKYTFINQHKIQRVVETLRWTLELKPGIQIDYQVSMCWCGFPRNSSALLQNYSIRLIDTLLPVSSSIQGIVSHRCDGRQCIISTTKQQRQSQSTDTAIELRPVTSSTQEEICRLKTIKWLITDAIAMDHWWRDFLKTVLMWLRKSSWLARHTSPDRSWFAVSLVAMAIVSELLNGKTVYRNQGNWKV